MRGLRRIDKTTCPESARLKRYGEQEREKEDRERRERGMSIAGMAMAVLRLFPEI